MQYAHCMASCFLQFLIVFPIEYGDIQQEILPSKLQSPMYQPSDMQ